MQGLAQGAANANVADVDSAEARARRRRETRANMSASEKLKSNATVIVAVFAGVVTSLVKFVAAAITGSSAMFSEGIHSMVDAINDSLSPYFAMQNPCTQAINLERPIQLN